MTNAAIASVKKVRSNLFRVLLEDEREFMCPDDTLVRWQLRSGKELTGEELQRLQEEAENILARREALAIVARASRSQQEVLQRLQRKGFSTAASQQAVERMCELDYINDLALAQRLVQEWQDTPDMGYWRQKQTLQRRGIAAPDIEKSLGQRDEETEKEKALRLARQRGAVRTQREMRRLAAYLHRRGYSESTVWWCLRQLAVEVDIDSQ